MFVAAASQKLTSGGLSGMVRGLIRFRLMLPEAAINQLVMSHGAFLAGGAENLRGRS